jgi:hypothetical protein
MGANVEVWPGAFLVLGGEGRQGHLFVLMGWGDSFPKENIAQSSQWLYLCWFLLRRFTTSSPVSVDNSKFDPLIKMFA